jgi:hypothetical protein
MVLLFFLFVPASLGQQAPTLEALRERAEWESGLMAYRDRAPQWETRVLQQSFWPGKVLFRVDCNCGESADVSPVTVAVSKDGKTAQKLAHGDGLPQRAEETRFTQLSRAESVFLNSETAGSYMSLFVTVNQRRGDVRLTGSAQARQVLALKRMSPESKKLAMSVGGKVPILPVVAITGPKYAGTTFVWDTQGGEVTSWQMVVDSRGRTDCEIQVVGRQGA